MLLALVILPALAGLAALVIKSDTLRRALLVAAAVAHTGLTVAACAACASAPLDYFHGYLMLEGLEAIFLAVTSALFLAAALYAAPYLARQSKGGHESDGEGMLFTGRREATFTCCLLMFLSTMTLVVLSRHLGLMWVAVEATTLASAPLIHFNRNSRSLEAAWKYLLICSVGIALALLGNFFLAAAATAGHQQVPMTLQGLLKVAGKLDPTWLKAAFLLFLVGYGTKMGLAPMHTWLPDAHSEAPAVVSALLSGALLNCAFLAILRVHCICAAAGLADFTRQLLVIFGLVSMAVAAVFIISQADFKRMLAYSSVEHMGILALGVGLGGAAASGAILHVMNHSLTKAMLFMLAGNILAAYRTKKIADVRGVLSVLPVSGVLWMAGFLAITGSPPFGPFVSELQILASAISSGQIISAIICITLLVIIFIGMARIFLQMSYGAPSVQAPQAPAAKEPVMSLLSPAILCVAVLMLGVYVPQGLWSAITSAAAKLGAGQ
jgi:hydrogenase-4 component F